VCAHRARAHWQSSAGLRAPVERAQELSELGVSREMSRSAYKAWQRKQRQRLAKRQGTVVGLRAAGGEPAYEGEAMDPFHACSRYYHVLGPDDVYGEAALKAALKKSEQRGESGGWFLVRKSNSEPLNCVTVSYIDKHGHVSHFKVPIAHLSVNRWACRSTGHCCHADKIECLFG